jgi:hypothetical protein
LRNLSISTATADRKDLIDSSKNIRQLSFGFRTQLIPTFYIPQAVQTAIAKVSMQQQLTAFLAQVGASLAANAVNSAAFAAAPPANRESVFKLAFDAQVVAALAVYNINGIAATALQQNALHELATDFINKEIIINASSTYAGIAASILAKAAAFMNTDQYRQFVKENISDPLEKLNKEPVGHMLEFAMASSMDFLSADLKKTSLGKAAGWFTYTYRSEENDHHQGEFLASFRETYDRIDTISKSYTDIGVRGVYQYKSKFSMSLEFLGRYRVDFDHCYDTNNKAFDCKHTRLDWRIFFNAEYKIMKNLSLTYGIGRDFDGNYVTNGNLVSLLGLNVGLGNAKVTPPTSN